MKTLDYLKKEKEELIDFFASQMKLAITKELDEAIEELEKIKDEANTNYKICKNCKYYYFMFCTNELSSAKSVDSHFGCNKWESEDEES